MSDDTSSHVQVSHLYDELLLKFYIAVKRMTSATKSIRHDPPHLRHVTTLPWEIKNSNFSDIGHIWKKMQTNGILSAPILIPLCV